QASYNSFDSIARYNETGFKDDTKYWLATQLKNDLRIDEKLLTLYSDVSNSRLDQNIK
ncbi:18754_t:CDS:1, partial [Racocetra persica]